MTDNYRPDLFGHVEASWRTVAPPPELVLEAQTMVCPDCNINVFVEEHPEIDGQYIIKRAHDETCPWLAQHERGTS